MPITTDKHCAAVANYMAGKVREYGFQLRNVVDAADRSLSSFKDGVASEADSIAYAFSALGNAMQSLKDALKTVGGTPLTWGDIGLLRHGDFIGKSRNAMTHDGNPIINAWIDGQFFVAQNISRLNDKGEEVEIVRPTADVRSLVLEFTEDFCAALITRLQPLQGQFFIGGAALDLDELEKDIMKSAVMPDFAKQLFAQNKTKMHTSVAAAPPVDSVERAIDELVKVQAYCAQAIASA